MGTTRKLIVEVVDARGLLPKDGHGTSSPYVVVDFYGQRRRTRTVHRNLNPAWNELLEFNVGAPSDVFGDTLELDVCHDRNVGPTRRNNFLGRIRLNSSQFVRKGEEALMYFPLEKKSFFSWIQGEIGLKIYYVNEPAVAPANPPPEAGDPPAESVVVEPPTKVEANDIVVLDKKQEKEAEKSDPGKEESSCDPPNYEQSAPPPESAEATTSPTVAAEPEVAPPPSANVDGVEEKPKEPELVPPTETPQPQPQPQSQSQLQAEPTMPAEMVASSVASDSVPDVRLAGFADARRVPLSRQTTSESFIGDPTDRIPNERKSYDLVEKMHYLFVKVVKARSLPTNGTPVVKISASNCHVRSKPARKTTLFEWDQTFAFGRESPESMSTVEVSVWDPPASLSLHDSASSPADVAGMSFLGGICFDVTEIPIRDPPDSPLAPQWYRLEGGGAHNGDLMLATWVGTQADEAFSDSWKTDTVGSVNSKSKVYLSPKLWYLRATVIEAQDIIVSSLTASKELSFQVRAQLGFQVLKSKPSVSRNGSLPLWNEDFIFVASEPFGFDDHLIMSLENRVVKGTAVLGVVRIPLTTIERRVDDRKVVSRWFSLEDSLDGEKKVYKGRIHLRLCFDGGYHVMDEASHVSSDYRPTARQLWKPHVGTVELGIIGCKSLIPMKTINGKGITDAYAVAKYGPKWVRTRTVSDSMDPRWNEQYTWRVYDPCTVLSLGVFDTSGVHEIETHSKEQPQQRIGKIRIRISTLQAGRVYRNMYPLLLLCPNGVRHMGEIELAVRFIPSIPTVDLCHVYTQPALPPMHHIKPLGVVQQEMLRNTASKIVAAHLSRSEPPLPREVVLYMLDANSHAFSMRKIRANWLRIVNVLTWLVDVARWVEDKRTWKNPTATLLVHALLVMLVWFPDLILPTLSFYVFVIGAWNYRFRPRDPQPFLDSRISLAESTDRDELDEEFDTVPSTRSGEVVRARYDKLRAIGARVQSVLGDVAAQGERVQALVTWRDPRATGVFIGLCLVVAVVLYVVPSKMVGMAFGFYYLRHPMFRDRMPSPALNFFRRLPSLSDRMM
ncbi:hypothetical protein Scep_002558 [Stephania cephalantha]|uniref:C2 domain-containing protein n=1 Tax=Stephania cephalantha TaxID=152367 RepID=A0AAP0LA48_9MAGN